MKIAISVILTIVGCFMLFENIIAQHITAQRLYLSTKQHYAEQYTTGDEILVNRKRPMKSEIGGPWT